MRHLLLPTALCLAIAACDDGQSPADSAAPETGAEAASDPAAGSSEGDAGREATSFGPLRYSYDPTILKRADVRTSLPPDYENERSGIKLVPLERAALLGERECSYGESGVVTACNAEQEAGLEIVQLDGSLSRWRETFADSRIGTGSLEDVEIGGATGFRFTAQVEGSGAEYNFLPAGDSTVLVKRRFRFGHDVGVDEIARVVENLRISR